MLSRILFLVGVCYCAIATAQNHNGHGHHSTRTPGKNLQDSLDRLSSQMHDLRHDVSGLHHRVRELERRQNDTTRAFSSISLAFQGLEDQIVVLDVEHDKLVAVNGIWKNNFKIVNNVLVLMKKKLRITSNGMSFPNDRYSVTSDSS